MADLQTELAALLDKLQTEAANTCGEDAVAYSCGADFVADAVRACLKRHTSDPATRSFGAEP